MSSPRKVEIPHKVQAPAAAPAALCLKRVGATPLTIFNLPMPALDDLAYADLPGAIDPGFVDLEAKSWGQFRGPLSLPQDSTPPKETMLDVGNFHIGAIYRDLFFFRGMGLPHSVETLYLSMLFMGSLSSPRSKME